MKQFNQALHAALSHHGYSKSEYAELIGVSNSAITKIFNGAKPRDDLFRTIIQSFTGKHNIRTRQALMLAHLNDEIERAGESTANYSVGIAGEQVEPDVAEALKRIENFVQTNPDMRTILMQFAGMHDAKRDQSLDIAAEDQGDYKTSK